MTATTTTAATTTTTTTVFWPDDISTSGVCYGWSEPCICVASVLSDEDDLKSANAFLQRIQPEWQNIGGGPRVLGRCDLQDGALSTRKLVLDFVPGTYTFAYYKRHTIRSLRFYALHPFLSLAISESEHASLPRKPLLDHDFTAPQPKPSGGLSEATLSQMNTAKHLESCLLKIPKRNSARFDPITGFETIVALASGFSSTISLLFSTIFSTPIPLGISTPLLKDISATIQQLDARTEQADFLTNQAASLSSGAEAALQVAPYAARYVNFYNTMWLVLNDITIGIAAGSFLCENDQALAVLLRRLVKVYLIEHIEWALTWLDSWPAGLKLNTELSRFYSHTFTDLVLLWGRSFDHISPYLPSLIFGIGILSSIGLTMSISLLSDLFSLFTGHIYICYLISTTIYRWQLTTLASLWNLFRGKRYNVLRKRMDSWEYDLDQLLFGTILFTLVSFLFPTVVAYHTLFALIRFMTVLVYACMETIVAFMNHFPLFAIMLRVKDPSRLPGGVYFKVVRPISNTGSTHLALCNQPITFSSIFFQYLRLWSRLSAHYNPLRLLKMMVTGTYVGVIPRYSMQYHRYPPAKGEKNKID